MAWPSCERVGECSGEFVVPGSTPSFIWEEHVQRYRFAEPYVAGKIVLDVACGVGYGTAHLAKRGPRLVVGGDIAGEPLILAQRQYVSPHSNFARLSAECLPFHDAQFDVIVCFETVEHLGNPVRFLNECRRVLRTDGVFLCSTPMRLSYRPPWLPRPVNPYHPLEYSISDFCNLLGTYFRDLELYGQSAFHPITVLRKYLAASAGRAFSRAPGLKTKLSEAVELFVSHRDGEHAGTVPEIKPIRRLIPGFPSYLIVKAIRRD
jgi:SAM-dependent methyltransferase